MAFIASRDVVTRSEVMDHLEDAVHPTPEESQLNASGRVHWKLRFLWGTTGLVKAQFLTKDGSGEWSATDAGRQALVDYPDPLSFYKAVDKAYDEWKASQAPAVRRAWLVRGSSVLGANLVTDWLADGYCSLAASQLRPIEDGITAEQVASIAAEDYDHLKHHELRAKVDEIVAFVAKMSVGDLVLTTSNENVFVGELLSGWTYAPSEAGRANLSREVGWRNIEAPIDFADLPVPLPARLQTGATILDLTADLALVDGLGSVGGESPVPGKTAARFEHLSSPTPQLAEELLVDASWLQHVRDLLDERRQVVFYGPPGTGKTYIARKLAADLVGPEQVKLVQFHPAYTYEDFFEGYRPAPGKGDGTINFELRAGPFRRLVDRARNHPDQAFVLIIDEINRANLAKVFGELYFLLEYRDQAVDLLYSGDEEGFTLPTNVFIIGTMNTADRSIALIDAAMRRRFGFLALDPDTEPTRSLLRRWSAKYALGATAADLLDALNARIDDPDLRIGPSYFMTSTSADSHSPGRLARIWETSILPLLQEHYYGHWEQERSRFKLSALLGATSAGVGEPDEPHDE